MNDIVLTGATAYDGTGADPFAAGIAINDGKIVAVGDHTGSGTLALECAGLCVAPGFIDVHTHDDYAVAVEPDMGFKVLGGVTTSIIGNCGEGPVPFEAGRQVLDGQYPDADLPPWPDYRSSKTGQRCGGGPPPTSAGTTSATCRSTSQRRSRSS